MSGSFAELGAELIQGQMRQKDERIAALEAHLAAARNRSGDLEVALKRVSDALERADHQLAAEQEKVRVLREAADLMYKAYMEGGSCAIIAAAHNLDGALQATAQEDK